MVCGFCETNYQELLDNYERIGIIKYLGMVNDIKEVMKSIHCLIHPSNYPEGISNVLLEASATGRAVITTNRTGCREVVDENLSGYLIQPNNLHDLVEKIEKFIILSREEKQHMGMNARLKVEIEFDRKRVVQAYMNAISSVSKGSEKQNEVS